jgi:hypothetical protein
VWRTHLLLSGRCLLLPVGLMLNMRRILVLNYTHSSRHLPIRIQRKIINSRKNGLFLLEFRIRAGILQNIVLQLKKTKRMHEPYDRYPLTPPPLEHIFSCFEYQFSFQLSPSFIGWCFEKKAVFGIP